MTTREEFIPVKVVLYTDILTAVLLIIDEIIFFITLMIFACYEIQFGLRYVLMSVSYFGAGLCFLNNWQKLLRSKKISIYMKKNKIKNNKKQSIKSNVFYVFYEEKKNDKK